MAFVFGDPRLFVMGAELTTYDLHTGNVVGYDNVGTDAAVNYTFEFAEIVGGMGNQLVGLIPHTTRLTGSYTSQAFSLTQRALLSGGALTSGGIAPICETKLATSATLAVSKTPAKSPSQSADDTYAWCYVRPHGATEYQGVNYGVNMTTKEIQNFTATPLTQYDIFYFTSWASAKQLSLPSVADPSIVSVHLKWAVYSEQNGSRSQGTLQGYLYVIVPKAILEGDAGINGSQTSNATTSYSWRAITGAESNMPVCADCDSVSGDLAYYVYVPCGNELDEVEGLVLIGGDPTLTLGTDEQIKVRYLMKDGTVAMPVYADLTFNTSESSVLTINSNGIMHPVGVGTSGITVQRVTAAKTLSLGATATVVNQA